MIATLRPVETSYVGLADRDYMKSERWQKDQREKRSSWFRRPRWARWRELRDDAWIEPKRRR
jgi:hypothetical protein